MDSPAHTFISESGLPSQRRRKVRLACNPCRARKTGCDGKKPVCTACSLRGWEQRCGWQDSVMTTNSAALTLVDLDRRLQRLESGNRVESKQSRPGPLDVASTSSSSHREVSSSTRDQGADSSDSDGDDPQVEESIADALHSNSTFMFHAFDTADPDSSLQLNTGLSTTASERIVPNLVGFSSSNVDPSFGPFDRQTIVLPPQVFANSLLHCYWLFVHSIFPILHRPTFEAEYSRLWVPVPASHPSNSGFEEIVFHATLNMVLALGCQRNESLSLSQREFQADEFYKRSQRLISIETLDATSMSIVQLLILRSLYLYFASRADRCWLMFGAAVRVAISIGLNTAGTKGHTTQLDREMRRRVWHVGCITLDQIVSSAFGRPPMIYEQLNQAPVALSINDEYLSTTGEGHQPDHIPSRLDFVTLGTKSVGIIQDMRRVVTFASRAKPGQGGSSAKEPFSPDPSEVLRINSRLDDFLSELPDHLRPDGDLASMGLSEDEMTCFRIQGGVLRSRVSFTRLLLLRPSLLAEIRRHVSPNPNQPVPNSTMRLQGRFHQEICSLCLSTVHSVLEEIHSALGTAYETPAWYALHFSFAAATILIVATLLPNQGISFDVEPTRSSWERAMQIMEHNKSYIASTETGIQAIRHFRDYIVSRVAARRDISPPVSTGSRGSPGSQSHGSPRELSAMAFGNQSVSGTTSGTSPNVYSPSNAYQYPYGHPDLAQYNQVQAQQPHGAGNQGGNALPQEAQDVTMMNNLGEFLGSNSNDQAWVAMQDFGQDNWILHY